MKTLKSKILVSLISVLVLCLSLAFAFSFNTTKVNATVDNDVFAMGEGASIALKKDGIRFRVQMGQNVYDEIFTNDANDDVKLSVLIAPKSFFAELDATENAGKYQQLSKKVEVEIDDASKIYVEDGYYYANAVLSNLAVANNNAITADQYDYEFVAVGCKTTTTGYEYTELSDVRTQYEVAQSAVLAEEDVTGEFAKTLLGAESPYKTWLGKAEHPVVVDSAVKFDALMSRVTNDVSFDNVAIEIKNDFGIADKSSIPASATLSHKVNFYNGSELVESKWVADGATAVASTTPVNDKIETDALNSAYMGYKFSKWVTEKDGETEVGAIENTANVYASFTKQDIYNETLAAASLADPSTAVFFSENFGWNALYNKGGNNVTQILPQFRWYSPSMTYNGEASTCYNLKQYESKDIHLGYNIAPSVSYTSSDYVALNAYFSAPAGAVLALRMGALPGVRVDANTWSTVVFKADTFITGGYFKCSFWGLSAGADVSIYFTSAKIVSASQIVDLESNDGTTSYAIGDTAVKYAYRYSWGTPWRDDFCNQATELGVHSVNGALMLYENDAASRQVGLTFATALTGKVYVTARGIGIKAVPQMQVFTDTYEGPNKVTGAAHKSSPKGTEVKDLGNGFKVWEFNFGADSIKYVRFILNGSAGRQVMITNISMTAPQA